MFEKKIIHKLHQGKENEMKLTHAIKFSSTGAKIMEKNNSTPLYRSFFFLILLNFAASVNISEV